MRLSDAATHVEKLHQSGKTTEEEREKILASHELFLRTTSKKKARSPSAAVRTPSTRSPSISPRRQASMAARTRSAAAEGAEVFTVTKHHRVRGNLHREFQVHGDKVVTINSNTGRTTNEWSMADVISAASDPKDASGMLFTVRRGALNETTRFTLETPAEAERLVGSLRLFLLRKGGAAKSRRRPSSYGRAAFSSADDAMPSELGKASNNRGTLSRTSRFGGAGASLLSGDNSNGWGGPNDGMRSSKKSAGDRLLHTVSKLGGRERVTSLAHVGLLDSHLGTDEAESNHPRSTREIIDAKLAVGQITEAEHARISSVMATSSVLDSSHSHSWSSLQDTEPGSPRTDVESPPLTRGELLARMQEPKIDTGLRRRKHRRQTQDVTKMTKVFTEMALQKEEHLRGSREQHRARMQKKRAQRDAAREVAIRRFSAIDIDNDGFIDRDELSAALPEMSPEESGALFDMYTTADAEKLDQRGVVKILLSLEERHLALIDVAVERLRVEKEAEMKAHDAARRAREESERSEEFSAASRAVERSHSMGAAAGDEELRAKVHELQRIAAERAEEIAELRRDALMQAQEHLVVEHEAVADSQREMQIQIIRLTEANMGFERDADRSRKRFDMFEHEAVAEISALEAACEDRLRQIKILTQEKSVAQQESRTLRLELVGVQHRASQQEVLIARLESSGSGGGAGGDSDEEDALWAATAMAKQQPVEERTRELEAEVEQLREQLRNALLAVAMAQHDRDEQVASAANELVEIRSAMHLQQMEESAPDRQTALSIAREVNDLRLSLGWKLRLLEDAMSRNQHELLLATMEKETALMRLSDHAGAGAGAGVASVVAQRVLESADVAALLERLVQQRIQLREGAASGVTLPRNPSSPRGSMRASQLQVKVLK